MPGDGKHRRNKGLVASRCDVDFGRCDLPTIDGAKMRRIGKAQIPVALDPPVTGGLRVSGGLFKSGCHVGMRCIAGNGLAHIDQIAAPAIIGGAPVLDNGYGRGGQFRNGRIEHQFTRDMCFRMTSI